MMEGFKGFKDSKKYAPEMNTKKNTKQGKFTDQLDEGVRRRGGGREKKSVTKKGAFTV